MNVYKNNSCSSSPVGHSPEQHWRFPRPVHWRVSGQHTRSAGIPVGCLQHFPPPMQEDWEAGGITEEVKRNMSMFHCHYDGLKVSYFFVCLFLIFGATLKIYAIYH